MYWYMPVFYPPVEEEPLLQLPEVKVEENDQGGPSPLPKQEESCH